MTRRLNIHVGASCFNLPWHRMKDTQSEFWLIEPNPYIRRRLLKKIREIRAKNALVFSEAITTTNGPVTLQCLSDEFLESREIDGGDEWMLGISRLENNNSGKNLLDQELFIPHVVYVEVEGVTLDTFFADYAPDRTQFEVETMIIDTEGHDFDIINSYSFAIRPRFLKIEHKHCTTPIERVLNRLKKVGYSAYVESEDIYALR